MIIYVYDYLVTFKLSAINNQKTMTTAPQRNITYLLKLILTFTCISVLIYNKMDLSAIQVNFKFM